MSTAIPAAALAQHIIALGKTGAGKSSKLRVLVEQLLTSHQPVTIIDPKGDWWGLKSSADGRSAGFPIVIFGGEHADVPINEHSGAHVAELVVTGNRPALIDLGGWMVGERTRFFIAFASTYFKLARGARHLVIDEVHNFAPQGKVHDPDAGKMLHWSNRLASEGRGKGITLLAASQRPQKVHKDFITSCETLIACKVIHKLDRDAIKDWIDGCADPQRGRDVLSQLAGMKKPEAWVWSPEIEFGPERVTFPMFRTYDSFKPQAADAGRLKGWADVDLEDVKSKLAVVVQEAIDNDPKRLRAKIADLQRDLSLVKSAKSGTSDDELRAAIASAEQRGHDRAIAAHNAYVDVVETWLGKFPLADNRAALPERPAAPISKPAQPVSHTGNAPRKSFAASTAHHRADLPRGEAAVLAALIQYPAGLRREQLTVLTGYKRSSRDSYIQRLREKGMVETSGDSIGATDAGRAALPDAEPLPTGKALQQFWFSRLPEGERAILSVLCVRYPDAVARDDLSEATGYKRSSRDSYLQRLSAKELIQEPQRGFVSAAEALFA